MLDLHDTSSGCDLAVRVQPNARRNALAGLHDQSLKVALAAPAVDGKANRALVEFLASVAGIARSRLAIVRGEKSRSKTVRFEGLDARSLLERLVRAGLDINSAGSNE